MKGQSNKEFSDPCEVFINTYLVPDYRYIDSTHNLVASYMYSTEAAITSVGTLVHVLWFQYIQGPRCQEYHELTELEGQY